LGGGAKIALEKIIEIVMMSKKITKNDSS